MVLPLIYDARHNKIENNNIRLTLYQRQRQLRFVDVINFWKDSPDFCQFYIRQLATIPFSAYFWECPPLTKTNLTQPFECIFIDCPPLADVTFDMCSFAEYFIDAGRVVDFDNIGGDARLIVPHPQDHLPDYAHLAIYSRHVDRELQQSMWQRVGQRVSERISDQPLWLSTSGLGVYCLHIRLDSSPKYYSYRKYRNQHYFKQDG